MTHQVLAYYRFVPIDDPEGEVSKHKNFLDSRDVMGRIYISPDGINGQFSGSRADAKAYMDWLTSDPRFEGIDFKADEHHENVFPRMTVKTREQLVAFDFEADPREGAIHVKPAQWKEMLESGEYLVLDVRNDYEWELGHFEGAERPPCATSRDFATYAKTLPKKKVMMCCTGGIRCELFSPLLKKQGFDEVYQLEGGMIKYSQEAEGEHWKGRLYVFDDRMAIDMGPKVKEEIAQCHRCGERAKAHTNCANMDCNELILVCKECLAKWDGCCSPECREGPRVRPAKHQGKPFRKWYNYITKPDRLSQASALE